MGEEGMSFEDMVEEYSKKWKVSREEAERIIRKILDKVEAKRPNKTPSPDNLFPEPIGEISKKIQDINQAVLSTAFTTRLLKNPPEEVAALRERIERIEAAVMELKSGIENKINAITSILDEETKRKQREELMRELENKMNPLKDTLNALAKKLESLEGSNTTSQGKQIVMEPSSILEQAERVAENAKNWLTKLGYKVEPEQLTRAEVQKMIEEAQKRALESLPPEEIKKRLEQAGYKVVGGPLTWEQVEKLVEEAKKKAQEEVIDDKRIDAVASIIRDSVSKIIDMFKPAVEIWLQNPPAGGETPRSTSSEQVVSEVS